MGCKIAYSSRLEKTSSMMNVGRAFAQAVKVLAGAVEVVETEELTRIVEVTGTEEVIGTEVAGNEELDRIEELVGAKGMQTSQTTANS